MDYLPPASVRVVPELTSLAFLAALLLAAAICASQIDTAVAAVGLYGALLGIGWLIAATLITHLCGGYGLALKPPELHGDFHVLSGFRVRVRLGNLRRRWPTLFAMTHLEASVEGVALNSPPLFTPELRPRAQATLAWDITVRKRGECELLGVRVRIGFPGSLGRHEVHFPFSQKMLALPVSYRLHSRALELLAGRRRASGRSNITPASMEEFIGVRDYRPGDNPRNVHLALSLRAPDFPYQLIVREFEDPSAEDVTVVLDTALPSMEDDDPLARYRHEKSLSFTVALCRLLSDHKYQVRFRTIDGGTGAPVDLNIKRPVTDLAMLEARLSRLRPSHDANAILQLLDKASARDGGAIMFVSLRESSADLERRHAVKTISPDLQAQLVKEIVEA